MQQPIKLAPANESGDFQSFFDLPEASHDRLTRQRDQSDVSELSVSEAARVLGITERTVWRRIRQKKLDARLDQGRTLVSVRQTDASLTSADSHTDASAHSPSDVTDIFVTGQRNDNTTAQLMGLITQLSSRLEGATYRNGYLEAQLATAAEQVKLLPDLQSRAAEAEELKLEIGRMKEELQLRNRVWWQRLLSRLFKNG